MDNRLVRGVLKYAEYLDKSSVIGEEHAASQAHISEVLTEASNIGRLSRQKHDDRIFDVDDHYLNLLGQIPGMWGCKDLQHHYICASQGLTRLLGFERQEDIVGCHDSSLPCSARECSEDYQLQDKLVIHSRIPLRILDIARFAGEEWRVQITTKFPLFDRKGGVIGVSFHVVDTASLGALELSQLLADEYRRSEHSVPVKCGKVEGGRDVEKITPKEAEVLFFMLRGRNAKMIAKVLGVSNRTIEHHIDSLKHKFDVSNKFDLIHFAIAKGYLNFMPPSLLGRQRSIVLGEFDPKHQAGVFA